MENRLKNKKKLILAGTGVLLLILALAFGLWFALARNVAGGKKEIYKFSLNERDVALNVGNTLKLDVIPDRSSRSLKPELSWISAEEGVATVAEDGTVTAVAGGETRVTAVARYAGSEYSVSCMVTVKAAGMEYSDYKIRWYTQKRDRSGYEVTEERFERLVGSKVELTEEEALKQVPENYTLNREKGVWSGTVKEALGLCILEVYFDVAEIDYYVDFYYESAGKLGSYSEKETKKFQAYAFSEVQAPENHKDGFTMNQEIGDQKKVVEAGSRLKVYYDRVRTEITVTYESGKESAVYTNVYGVGPVDAPADAFVDSLDEYFTTSGCYINGQRSSDVLEDLKQIAYDVLVEVKLENISGWFYNSEEDCLENLGEKNSTTYAYLKGKGSTVYLSATYDITGSESNMFGITLRSGDTSRQFWFADRGVYVRKDHWYDSGVIGDAQFKYNNGGSWEGGAFVWAQNNEGAWGTEVSSVVADMLQNRSASSHDMVWAVYEGILYGSVDGETVLRLPLNHFDETWTAEKQYEIGFSTFDGPKGYDELKIRNVTVCFDEEAEKKLHLEQEVQGAQLDGVAYDVLTGVYLPATSFGFSTLNNEATAKNTGISADIQMLDMENSASGYGVTVQVGDRSVQYLMQCNDQARRQDNYGWDSVAYLRTLDLVKPFDSNGNCHVEAFVKDGYFYILYNGIQAQCVNMLSMFPEYVRETSEVEVGLCTCDANLGLAQFRNVKLLSEKEVDAAESAPWRYYSETPDADSYDFAEGSFTSVTQSNKKVSLYGKSKTWQVTGTMERTNDAEIGMGFEIRSGEKVSKFLGFKNGILAGDDNGWINEWIPEKWRTYLLNDKADAFFGQPNTRNSIDYKAVIFEDVLYVWFDGELCWRVPLTDNELYNFDADSDYELALYIKSDMGGFGRMTNLDTKMGYQVTEQTAFETDSKGKNYSFAEAMTILKANIETYLKAERSGMMLEALEGNYVTAKEEGVVYLYGDRGTGDRGVSTDIRWLEKEGHWDSGALVTLKMGDASRQFMVWSNPGNYHNGLFYMTGHQLWYNEFYPEDFWGKDKEKVDLWDTVKDLATPFGADGNSHVEAFVKDGYFYVKYNGKQALCINMVSLFQDYDPATSEIAVGIGGVYNNGNQARFSNTTFLSEGDIAEIESTQWGYYSSAPATDSYSFAEGSFTSVTQSNKNVSLLGKNKTWQVTGTMERTNDAEIGMGFEIRSGEKVSKFLGFKNGILAGDDNGWINEWIPEKWRTYLLNDKADAFFGQPNTRNSIDYKAVIFEDVLYVWFDGELCWRVPLTDNELYNFDADSDYELALYIKSDMGGFGRMTNLDTKMGYQVTEQTAFETDSKGKNYSFAEAMTILKANIETYLKAERSGMMLEALEGNYVTAKEEGVVYLYGDRGTGDRGVSTDIRWLEKEGHWDSGALVTLKMGDASRQFMVWSNPGNYHNGLFYMTGHQLWYNEFYPEDFWGKDKEKVDLWDTVKDLATPFGADGNSHVEAFVKDGYFYVKYNGKQALCINMVSLFQDYDPATSEIAIGIGAAHTCDNQARFSNTTFLSGEDIADIGSTQWGYYSNDPATDTDGYSFAEGSFQATSKKWPGQVMPLLGKSKTWQVTGTMERTNAEEIGMGFRIRSGEKELRLLGFANGILAGYDGEGNWPNQWIPEKWKTYLLNDKADAFFGQPNTSSSIDYKAVIFEDVLYVWFDGELCWCVPLTDNELYNFDAGSDYELSLFIKSDGGGFGRMKDINVKMGYQVTEQAEFEKDSEGVWHSFTDTMDIFQKTLGVENSGMILEDPLTGTYVMSDKGSVWLYGEKKIGECGLSTDIAWLSTENWWDTGAFISVRIGTEERLFMAWANKNKFNNGLFYLTAPALWSNKFTGDDAWGNPLFQMGELPIYKEDGTSHIEAYVQGGSFHIKYNGQELVNRSMTELFPEGHGNYDANTSQVSIGIGGLQTDQNQARFSNTIFLPVEDNVRIDSQAMKQEQAASQTKQEKTALLQAAVLPGKSSVKNDEKSVAFCCADIVKGAFLKIRKR